MPLEIDIALDIENIKTENFYFSIIPQFVEGQTIREGDLGLSQIAIWDDSYTILDIAELIYSTEFGAIFAVTLPRQTEGRFNLQAGGVINVNGVEEDIISDLKIVKYDTRTAFSEETFDPTPPNTEATEVSMSVSARYVRTGETVLVQVDFDFDVHYFRSWHLHLSEVYATKGNAEAIDERSRRWIVPVTTPSTGEGTLDIFIPANSFRFDHSEVRISVDYAEEIPLVIEAG